jgi:hypothetical protein
MASHPIFLSLVCVLRNQSDALASILTSLSEIVAPIASDYEILIIDNASSDDSIAQLKALSGAQGIANLQVFALTKEVDADTAAWVGLENALGDFVAVIDPLIDDAAYLPTMVDHALSGTDVVFASNTLTPRQRLSYRIAFSIFNRLYVFLNGIHLAKEAPYFRLLSRRVVNFILQHPQPAQTYRHLPASGGFARTNLSYSATPRVTHTKHLGSSIDRGMRLLVSSSRTPLRLVTALCLFGAMANILYSLYVVLAAILLTDIAPGWVSLSLQQSGMFFLISLVLMVLSEYILNMASLSNHGPLYHVGQEFTSARMTLRDKLNVEDSSTRRA